MKTDTATLIETLRILAVDIQSEDGIANAAIAEAADRLEELQAQLIPAQWFADGDEYVVNSPEDVAEGHDFPDCGILEIKGWALTQTKYAVADWELLDRTGNYGGVFHFFDTREEAEEWIKATEESK